MISRGGASPHGKLPSWNVEILGRFLGPIDQMLKAQDFVIGAEFTVADIILSCVLPELRKNEVLGKYPNIESCPG